MLVDAVSYLGSVFFLRRIRSPEPPVEPEEGTTRERLLAGLSFPSTTRSCARRCCRSRRSTCSRSPQGRCSSCTPRPSSASRREPSGWRWARGRSARSSGPCSRRGSVGGSGSDRPTLSASSSSRPRCCSSRSRRPGCRCCSSWPCCSVRSSVPGFGVMILDINVGAIIYARTPDRIRARAGGAFRFVNYGVRPIGAVLGGLLGTAHRRPRGDLGQHDRGHRRRPVPHRVPGPSPARPAGGAGLAAGVARRLLPAEGPGGDEDASHAPGGEDDEGSAGIDRRRPERHPEGVRQRRRRQDLGERRQRPRQVRRPAARSRRATGTR